MSLTVSNRGRINNLQDLIATGDVGTLGLWNWSISSTALRAFALAEVQISRPVPLDGAAFPIVWPEGNPYEFPAPNVFVTFSFYTRARLRLIDVLAAMGLGVAKPWASLPGVIHLRCGASYRTDSLWMVKKLAIEFGLAPADLTHDWAVDVDRPLTRWERNAFRSGISMLDRLWRDPAMVGTNMLPIRELGPMPCYIHGIIWHELTPRLEADCRRLPGAGTSVESAYSAIRILYNLGLSVGILKVGVDVGAADLIEPKVWRVLEHADMTRVSAASPVNQARCRALAARSLAAVTDFPDPRRTSPWSVLSAAARRIAPDIGRRLHVLAHVKKLAKEEGKGPADLEDTWACTKLASIEDRVKRNATRSALGLMNALRGVGEGALLPMLPAEPFDLVALGARRPRTPKRPMPPDLSPKGRWTRFFVALRAQGHEPTRGLYELRREAIARGCGPEQLSRAVAEEIVGGCDECRRRAPLREGLRDLDGLRGTPAAIGAAIGKTPIGQLPDRRRRGNLGLPRGLLAELEGYQAQWGYADNTRRVQRSALAAHMSIGARLGVVSDERWPSLRRAASAATLDRIEAGIADEDAASRRAQRVYLDAISSDLALPFTPAWKRLQAALRVAGVPPRADPLRALLSAPACPEPFAIADGWTQAHLASLRNNERLAFKAALDKFDALHDEPSIAETGLLPRTRLRRRAPGTRLGVFSGQLDGGAMRPRDPEAPLPGYPRGSDLIPPSCPPHRAFPFTACRDHLLREGDQS